jgi:hypothetical protein
MLRDAIQKVKAEIAHHENEAKKHLQLANELRKDLRDCFTFFQQWGTKEEATIAAESASVINAEPATTASAKEPSTTSRQRRGGTKKKSAGRKTR